MFSIPKSDALSFEKVLVYAALGYYLYRQVNVQKNGSLGGNDWMVKIDKEKMFKMAEKKFNLNPIHRGIMERLFNSVLKGEDQ